MKSQICTLLLMSSVLVAQQKLDEAYTAKIREFTTDKMFLTELVDHLPDAASISKYEDDLLRQNSLIHHGWRVFRWTDRQIAHEPERVKEQLALFLERLPELLAFDDFLPKQMGELVELRVHQDDALQALQKRPVTGHQSAELNNDSIYLFDRCDPLNVVGVYRAGASGRQQ